ncbi:MAG: hypothetical protein MK188_05670 [Gammaproteobacteria bacterium]|nr:hypothetical protein [Gammaproteobacteria bacterium]
MRYTIVNPDSKITLEEIREAILVFPSASEAGEYFRYDELTGDRVGESGMGRYF